MKFTINSNYLLEVLVQSSLFVSKKTTMPELACFKLSIFGEILEIASSDAESSFITTAYTDVKRNGSVLINAKTLIDIIKKLPDVEIDCETIELNTLRISTNHEQVKTKYNIKCLDASNFPEIPTIPQPKHCVSFEICKSTLDTCIKYVDYATAKEQYSTFLTGINIRSVKNKLSFCATNGKRLSIADFNFTNTSNINDFDIIVPCKPLQELIKINPITDNIKVFITSEKIFFILDNIQISITLLEGNFPDYEKIIPTQNAVVIKVMREALYYSLCRVLSIADVRTHQITLNCNNNEFSLSSLCVGVGDSQDVIGLNLGYEKDGEDINIGLNGNYLVQVLKESKCELIKIEMNAPDKPIVISELANDEKINYKALIMPIKLITD